MFICHSKGFSNVIIGNVVIMIFVDDDMYANNIWIDGSAPGHMCPFHPLHTLSAVVRPKLWADVIFVTT